MELTVLELILGPMGALLVMALVIWWVARLVEKKLIPAAEKFIGRHLDQIDALVTSHDNDRTVWAEGMLGTRADMDAVKEEVHQIRQRIEVVLAAKVA